MIYPAVWANGEYASGKNGNNPYALVNSGGTKDEWYNKVGGRAAINITPIEGLKISGVIAPNYTYTKIRIFAKLFLIPWKMIQTRSVVIWKAIIRQSYLKKEMIATM